MQSVSNTVDQLNTITVAGLMAQPEIDGALVGGASLDVYFESFLGLLAF